MPLAVRFDEYGDVDVLKVVDVPRPVPGPGQVLVKVKAAGINPGEASIRKGLLNTRWPATFPSGEGWRWKAFKKDFKEGEVILQLDSLKWNNQIPVLFVFK